MWVYANVSANWRFKMITWFDQPIKANYDCCEFPTFIRTFASQYGQSGHIREEIWISLDQQKELSVSKKRNVAPSMFDYNRKKNILR